MPAQVYLASFGVVSSLFMFRWALARGPRTTSAARSNLGLSASRNDVVRRPKRIVRIVDRLPFLGTGAALQRRIAIAGLPWRTDSVRFFRLVALSSSLVLGGLVAAASRSLLVPVILVAAGVAFALLPDYLIAAKAQERQAKLEEQLPDILDRLKITLEAGLGFDSALANVIRDRSGPVMTSSNACCRTFSSAYPETKLSRL